MKTSEYKKIFKKILEMSFDMDGVSINNNSSKYDIEKCKWIKAILTVLDDVPKRKMEYMFRSKKISFKLENFLDENL